ncbi:hypothetical protein [Streptomyces sannanensis]|uniref:hypothetical protein n=1 Tax=Streptomyces sannanensis TaxID=285536 RepID=UPI0031EA2EF5
MHRGVVLGALDAAVVVAEPRLPATVRTAVVHELRRGSVVFSGESDELRNRVE